MNARPDLLHDEMVFDYKTTIDMGDVLDPKHMLNDLEQSFRNQYGGLRGMHKKDYDKLAKAISKMADPIRSALSADGGATTRQIVEIIAAQIGLVLGADNPNFDSWRFVETIEKDIKK